MKENRVYSVGKNLKEVCSDFKFNARKNESGMFLWKFPKNLLFMSYEHGDMNVSIVMEEKTFIGIYKEMSNMDTDRAYRMTRKGVSKKGMKRDQFKRKMEHKNLTPDVYITKGKESIVFWICGEQQTLETLSISFSQMGEIYEKLKEV